MSPTFRHLLPLHRRATPRSERAGHSGTGEILLESADRAAGYFTTRMEAYENVIHRTSGVYLRADDEDSAVVDAVDNTARAALIAARIQRWRAIVDS
jgi:hypothetical protein